MNTTLIVICATVVIFLVIICVTVLISDWMSKLCKHEWEQVEDWTLMPPGDDDESSFPCGKMIVLRCKKCGEVKCKKIEV